MSTVYDRIKALADEQGIPIYQLERQAGIGNAVIRTWTDSVPMLDKILAVAKVLGVTVSDLIGDGDAVPKA